MTRAFLGDVGQSPLDDPRTDQPAGSRGACKYHAIGTRKSVETSAAYLTRSLAEGQSCLNNIRPASTHPAKATTHPQMQSIRPRDNTHKLRGSKEVRAVGQIYIRQPVQERAFQSTVTPFPLRSFFASCISYKPHSNVRPPSIQGRVHQSRT